MIIKEEAKLKVLCEEVKTIEEANENLKKFPQNN